MSAPETTARQSLIAVLATEFAAEQFPIKDDRIHQSLGHSGTVIGVSPERTISAPDNRYVNQIEILVQFYGKYNKEVDPKQTVSPSTVEGFAERFRSALRTGGVDPNTGLVWYFVLDRIEYPPDPTGNKTRFEAFLVARGNNSALVETVP